MLEYEERMSQYFQHSTHLSSQYLVEPEDVPSVAELVAYQFYSWMIYARLILRGRGVGLTSANKILEGLFNAIRESIAILMIPRIASEKKRQAQRVFDINACYIEMEKLRPRECEWVVNFEDDAEPNAGLDQIVSVIGSCISELASDNVWLVDLSESFSSEDLQLSETRITTRRTFASTLKTYDLPYLTCNTFCALLLPAGTMRAISNHLKRFSSAPVLRLLPCDWVLLVLGFDKKGLGRSYLSYEGQLFSQGSLKGR